MLVDSGLGELPDLAGAYLLIVPVFSVRHTCLGFSAPCSRADTSSGGGVQSYGPSAPLPFLRPVLVRVIHARIIKTIMRLAFLWFKTRYFTCVGYFGYEAKLEWPVDLGFTMSLFIYSSLRYSRKKYLLLALHYHSSAFCAPHWHTHTPFRVFFRFQSWSVIPGRRGDLDRWQNIVSWS